MLRKDEVNSMLDEYVVERQSYENDVYALRTVIENFESEKAKEQKAL